MHCSACYNYVLTTTESLKGWKKKRASAVVVWLKPSKPSTSMKNLLPGQALTYIGSHQ